MARPPKVGLEYFSLDVKMDDEVEIIKGQFGIEGFGILIAMYQSIYEDKGYYKKWNERNQILFSNKVSVSRNLVASVINDCIKWDIFNQKLYKKYNILTSKRIQKQYIGATYKRSEVEIIREYLLLKDKDIDRKNISCVRVSDIGNPDTNIVSDSKSTQSNKDKDKDKDSKVNKHAEEISAVHKTWVENLSDINDARLTKKQKKTILTKLKKWDKEDLIHAIENYNEIYRSSYYYSHNFTMFKFIKQSNGAPRFLPGLDQEYDGDIWKDYLNNKEGKNEKQIQRNNQAKKESELGAEVDEYFNS